MRFIVDTNQLSAIRRSHSLSNEVKRQMTIVLPPLVRAEGVLFRHGANVLRELSSFNLRFGMDLHDVYSAIGSLTAAQARQFDPIVPHRSQGHRNMKRNLLSGAGDLKAEAQRISGDKTFVTRLIDGIAKARKQMQDQRSKGILVISPRLYETSAEVFNLLALDVKSSVAVSVLPDVRPMNRKATGENDDAVLWNKVLSNQFACRFLRTYLTYMIAFVGNWRNPQLNLDPSVNRNDVTDIMLSLYAGDGDIILTEDKHFTKLFRHAESENRVRVMTWEEYLRIFTHSLKNQP